MKNLFQFLLLMFLFTGFFLNAAAQKKWDGQGNDSLWTNPKNWFPDGLPGIADNVLLDNSIVNTNLFQRRATVGSLGFPPLQ